ncbi:spore germination protein [Dehalobacter sp. DCM]|uniref:spore germination protein n=1 Tax=Dehalobacter sp. DCM TaxID=2907827 RepID=UPI003081473D|nr:spore germination protein [Dehalobacter sp. DCM]
MTSNKQQPQWKKILSLITYKKTNRPKTFSLGEDALDQDPLQTSTAGFGKDQNKASTPQPRESTPKQKNEKGQKKESPKPEQRNTSQQRQGQQTKQDKEQNNDSAKTKRKMARKPMTPGQVRSYRSDPDHVRSEYTANLELIKQLFGVPRNKDLVIREFRISQKKRAFIAYLDGMADKMVINDFILKPLLAYSDGGAPISESDDRVQPYKPYTDIILTNDIKSLNNIQKVLTEILKGNTAVYIDGLDYFLTCESIGYEKRGVESPKTEGIVKGPQEAFGENLRTNISLLRRIIRNSHLMTEFFEVGERSSTTLAIVYLGDIANPSLVGEVRRRLQNIKTDFLVSAGMLEELIEDNPLTIIPTILSTERPDRTASHIVEGRVVILTDGAPFAMIVPVTMNEFMHSPEDAALKWQYTSALRFIRFFAFLAASMLPGLYIAMTTFHREMIPTDLLIAIAKAKENVPFPTLVEILLMELGFELIREAGIRIPGIIGNTLGIIGALILGDAAVSANIVSPILIIIVAVTGLSNFAIPNYSLAFGVRLTRFYYIIAGTLLGFYGIALAVIGHTLMMVNLKSFGIPFFSVIAPTSRSSRDKVVRWPLWMQEKRPDFLNTQDIERQPEIARQWAQQDPDKG